MTEKTEANEARKPKDPGAVKKAIELGQEMISKGETKISTALAMYELVHSETQELVVDAFISGANLTPKGALTYWYNCKRKYKIKNP